MNLRPSGYEPDELPGCSIPRYVFIVILTINKISTKIDPVYDKSLFFPLNKTYQKYVGEYYSPFKIKKLLEDLDELIEISTRFAALNAGKLSDTQPMAKISLDEIGLMLGGANAAA